MSEFRAQYEKKEELRKSIKDVAKHIVCMEDKNDPRSLLEKIKQTKKAFEKCYNPRIIY